MVVKSKFLLGFVQAKNTIGLMKGTRNSEWNSPQTISSTRTCNDSRIHFNDFDVIFGKNSFATVIAELGERDERAGAKIVEDERRLCSIAEEWREWESATLRCSHDSTTGRENSGAIGNGN
jgi:hypothetical protein